MVKSKSKTRKIVFAGAMALVVVALFVVIYFVNKKANADLTTEVKTSQGSSLARFQINPKSSWNAPTSVSFRVAAARYMFYGASAGGGGGAEQSPKVTGRFFCNKPFVPGYTYPTGLYEPPDAKFEDGSSFTPTDIMDGHNGMRYSLVRGDAVQADTNTFWNTTVSTEYVATCNYTQPGEYWPLFYADGLGAWYTQKIVVTGSGVITTPTPSATPVASVVASVAPSTVSNQDLYKAGYSVIGFKNDVQTGIFGQNGMQILSFNSTSKSWDITNSGDYLFQAGKAYYVKTDTDKYLNKIVVSPSDPGSIVVGPGWNLIWTDNYSYLGDIYLTINNSSGQCSVKNVPLRTLKDANMVYKWIYNIVDDKSTVACQAFSLLTGKDQQYSGCTASNPLLNEVSYAKAKSGTWIYVWPNKTDSWAQKPALKCN